MEVVSQMNGWGEGEKQGVVTGLYPSVNYLLCPTAFYGVGKLLQETPVGLEMIKM